MHTTWPRLCVWRVQLEIHIADEERVVWGYAMLHAASVPARGDLQRCRSVGCGRCRVSIHQRQMQQSHGCRVCLHEVRWPWAWHCSAQMRGACSMSSCRRRCHPCRPCHDLAALPQTHPHHWPRSQQVCSSMICLPFDSCYCLTMLLHICDSIQNTFYLVCSQVPLSACISLQVLTWVRSVDLPVWIWIFKYDILVSVHIWKTCGY
jgi:hypothetical protein